MGWTFFSAIRTVILPSSAQVVITRWVFRALRVPFRILGHDRRTYEARDRVMALYAPVGLVVLSGVWLLLVSAGSMLARFRRVACELRRGAPVLGGDHAGTDSAVDIGPFGAWHAGAAGSQIRS